MRNLIPHLLIPLICILLSSALPAQRSIRDESITYQQQRMVFRQWDSDKFTPKSGFLGLNPYYWLVWGLHPNYPKTDLRPLSPFGPQTQRLSLSAAMSEVDRKYALSSDSLAATALEQINEHSPLLSDADPLWLLYYKKQLKPVYEFDAANVLASLSGSERFQVIRDGNFEWYKSEMESLAERLLGSQNAVLDRGSRILSYYRYLEEYKKLRADWSLKVKSISPGFQKQQIREKLKKGEVKVQSWTPSSDIEIARGILRNRKY